MTGSAPGERLGTGIADGGRSEDDPRGVTSPGKAPGGIALLGLARLLELLTSADPAEAATVLATLDDADLAAAMAAAPQPTPCALSDFVIASGGPASLAALAERAFRDRVDDGVDTVLRRLVHKGDPALDAVLRAGAQRRPVHAWVLPLLDQPRAEPVPAEAVVPQAGAETGKRANRPTGALAHFNRLRLLALGGLADGTLTPDGLLARPPALLSVILAAPIAHPVPRHPARPGCAALRAGLADLLADRLGDDPAAWSAAIGRVDTWPGPLTGLLDAIAAGDPADATAHGPAGAPAGPGRATPPDSDRDTLSQASNVLLAAAPPDVAAACLAGPLLSPALVRRMARRWPLCRALVDHVLTSGTDHAALARPLAENDLTPDTVLVRLIGRYPDDAAMMTAIVTREFASGGVRLLAVRRFEALNGGPYGALARLTDPALASLLEAADDPVWLSATLHRIGPRIPAAVRVRGYAVLTRLAGVETAWAAELHAAGDLGRAAEAVRASMAEGTDGPIRGAAMLAAAQERIRARALAGRGHVWNAGTTVGLRTEEGLDRPLEWPVEDLVRTVLDGRPERWAALTDLLRAGASEPWEQLVPRAALSVPEKEEA